ncbi:hypothetical protein TVAG_355050 [Trichomonas vaginalis G3]|uniref:RIIa domain-containing protein n=1 Tax=Trichomonas vaginalis (strain ATCC PRA-98 / G3) TaxID=412133 RepID=A2EFZ0_TRIV3|nr:Dimerization-anchoring domain of cAMP-dependent PK regulatory subunit family [Trichomonas vaginalis G3]EAY08446.1 hypothetical protein TVAG_355050 [Trichomonas vaginalis G3]KAI5518122.1 Dimerization-anchoring domain of cAMP-dependent PK regulatory subunit family [Trichomonas vaginalis G3]|eukprot:XP_001320669.1 hypothetical protein [Trichomonas vaginalis G3]
MEVSEEKLDRIRIDNEKYLRKHPELHDMISEFMVALLKDKPQDVLQYAIVFFTSQHTEPE